MPWVLTSPSSGSVGLCEIASITFELDPSVSKTKLQARTRGYLTRFRLISNSREIAMQVITLSLTVFVSSRADAEQSVV